MYFLIIFLNNAEKSSAPFMEIRLPHDKCFHGKILPCNSLPLTRPPPPEKSPLKTFQ